MRQKAINDILTDEEFWARMSQQMAGSLASVAARIVLQGASSAQSAGVVVDFDAIHQEALDVARNTSSRWWGTMVDTTREGVRRTLINYVETGLGKRGLPDLVENLERWFEPERAKRIAVTETTRLFAEGNLMAGDMDDSIGGYQWQTGRSEQQVCGVCWPRNGKIYPKGQVPECPAHTNCYCSIQPASWEYIREHLDQWQGGELPAEYQVEPEPEIDFEQVPQFKSTQEAEQWLINEGYTPMPLFKGFDVKVAQAISQAVYENCKLFPQLKGRIEVIGNNLEMNRIRRERSQGAINERRRQVEESADEWAKRFDWGAAERKRFIDKRMREFIRLRVGEVKMGANVYAQAHKSWIFVASKWAKNANHYEESLRECVASGFHPTACDTVKSTIDHEIAHIIDNKTKITADTEIRRMFLDAINSKTVPSEYARKNLDEFMAECWSEYRNNHTPSAVSKAVGDRIIELLKVATWS